MADTRGFLWILLTFSRDGFFFLLFTTRIERDGLCDVDHEEIASSRPFGSPKPHGRSTPRLDLVRSKLCHSRAGDEYDAVCRGAVTSVESPGRIIIVIRAVGRVFTFFTRRRGAEPGGRVSSENARASVSAATRELIPRPSRTARPRATG